MGFSGKEVSLERTVSGNSEDRRLEDGVRVWNVVGRLLEQEHLRIL